MSAEVSEPTTPSQAERLSYTHEIPQQRPIACLRCRERKVKCDRALPACMRCVKAGIPCVDAPKVEKRYVNYCRLPIDKDYTNPVILVVYLSLRSGLQNSRTVYEKLKMRNLPTTARGTRITKPHGPSFLLLAKLGAILWILNIMLPHKRM